MLKNPPYTHDVHLCHVTLLFLCYSIVQLTNRWRHVSEKYTSLSLKRIIWVFLFWSSFGSFPNTSSADDNIFSPDPAYRKRFEQNEKNKYKISLLADKEKKIDRFFPHAIFRLSSTVNAWRIVYLNPTKHTRIMTV